MPHQTQFSLQYTLNIPFDTVYNSLLDLKVFGELHPHMKVVEIIDNKLPEYMEYHVQEEIYLFGFLKNHPAYTAKVYEVEKRKHIRYTSPVKPYIWLVIDFIITEGENKHVTVNETIALTCHPLLAKVFSKILTKAHAKLFSRIDRGS